MKNNSFISWTTIDRAVDGELWNRSHNKWSSYCNVEIVVSKVLFHCIADDYFAKTNIGTEKIISEAEERTLLLLLLQLLK